MRYRDFEITNICPPIPTRSCDWEFAHVEYDGPEDNRIGHGPTVEDCKRQIDEWYEEEGDSDV